MKYIGATFTIFAELLWLGTTAFAQPVPELDLKAAYVYNFAIFTEWPPESMPHGSPINICLRGDNAMHAAVTALTAKTVKGRRLAIKPWQAPDDLQGCHMVIFDAGDRARWNTIKGGLAGASLLTVSDDADAATSDFIITMRLDNGRLTFSVNNTAARQARLLVSAKLLRLAKEVK
ncbi:MAG: hypothetical protein A3I66_24140 [Burkholderiales bacterium RIFCSPLOWO2_02_FULL_57_36]|nr:MAG: hypothetical protein A3I66_24140 [Burkholderiales bacterium RIFCSPLOWO2_02_FULL_57_36]